MLMPGERGALDETRDHGFELIAPVAPPGETGEAAPGAIGAEPAIASRLDRRILHVAEHRVRGI